MHMQIADAAAWLRLYLADTASHPSFPAAIAHPLPLLPPVHRSPDAPCLCHPSTVTLSFHPSAPSHHPSAPFVSFALFLLGGLGGFTKMGIDCVAQDPWSISVPPPPPPLFFFLVPIPFFAGDVRSTNAPCKGKKKVMIQSVLLCRKDFSSLVVPRPVCRLCGRNAIGMRFLLSLPPFHCSE